MDACSALALGEACSHRRAVMDAVLHEQFQRVEAALGTLVDSIASYNPSPQAAADLIAADEELGRRLDQRRWSIGPTPVTLS